MQERPFTLGSGVIIDVGSYVVTNHHVINNAEKSGVKLHDGRTVASLLAATKCLNRATEPETQKTQRPVRYVIRINGASSAILRGS